MKKLLFIVIMIVVFTVSGCEKSVPDKIVDGDAENIVVEDNNGEVESEKNDDFRTIGGEIITSENASFFAPSYGFGFIAPDYFNVLAQNGKIGLSRIDESGVKLEYVSTELVEFLDSLNELDDEDFSKRILDYEKYAFNIFGIFRLDTVNVEKELESYNSYYSNIEELGSIENKTYYFAYNTDYGNFNLTEDEVKELDKIIDSREDFKNGIAIIGDELQKSLDEEEKEKVSKFNLVAFTGMTLDGTELDKDFIKNNKLTMINVWTTWCGPCVNEMPELAILSNEMMPDGVKLLSICADGDTDADLAREIIKDSGGKFPVVIIDENIRNTVMPYVDAFPTTIFVDENGILVGDKMVGAPYDDVAKAYLSEINKRLEIINNK